MENLVLTLQNNNTFSAKVISYDLTQSEKDLLQNGMFVDVSSKMQVINLDNGSTIANDIFARSASGCYDVIIEYEMCCHNIHSTLNVQNGQHCTCPKPPTGYTYTITSIPCNENGSGGEAPGDTSPGDYTSPGNDILMVVVATAQEAQALQTTKTLTTMKTNPLTTWVKT